jgi:acyl-CoA reductase-like NAD-dependent aldehyde dehydrogenase
MDDPLDIREICRQLKARHAEMIKTPIDEIVAAIDRTSARWRVPDDPFRRSAEEKLPALTGLSRETIRWGLESLFSSLRRGQLEALLAEEFFDPSVLDRFVPKKSGGMTRAVGAPLTVQILSGNIPGLAVQALVFSLLVKSPTLLKPAAEEPLLAALFADSLAETDPFLSSCLAVVPWKGGDLSIETAVFEEAEAVVAYGQEESLTTLRERVPRRLPMITFGPKLSIGVIGNEFIDEKTAESAAVDLVRFGTRGCLSPQIFYVEEKSGRGAERFAGLLADRIGQLRPFLPAFSLEETGRVQQLRGLYRMKERKIFEAGGFLIVIDPEDALSPTGGRVILVKPLNDLSSIPLHLEPLRGSIQGIGLAIDQNRHPALLEKLSLLGVSRLCPIGRLQEPPFTWHQEGRPRLADRVRWVDLEE